MKVLVICPTYGRVHLLNRVTASFLSQTYTNSDMVIINDDPHVKISCDNDRIITVNIDKKLILDEKRNIGSVMGANYDLIVPLDDDDIFLPRMLQYYVDKFKENPEMVCFRNRICYKIVNNVFKVGIGCPNNCAYRPSEFFRVGGYSYFDRNSSGDVKFSRKVNNVIIDDKDKIYFIYTYLPTNYHLSSVDEHTLEERAEQNRKELGVGGEFKIVPSFDKLKPFAMIVADYMKIGEPINIIPTKDGGIKYEL